MFPNAVEGDDCREKYYSECKKAMTPAIDILNGITDQMLVVENYKLTDSQCEGLRKCFYVDDKIVSRILIDNCGVSDEMLSKLIDGASKLKKIKILNLKAT
jgi:hypothetical protein